MSAENLVTEKSKYGTLGLDVGFVGRWSRLIWGLLILVPTATNILLNFSPSSESLRFYGLVLVYFAAITLAYTGVYWSLGERGILQRLNIWVNTAIFVLPAFILAWWDFVIAPATGTRLPLALSLAMFIYIGISFILQWRIKYGGCEVVSIPIIFFRKRYPALSVCPLCDGGLIAPELDHFYPKARYSYLSCHPLNLVPICKDCNGRDGKHDKSPLNIDNPDDQFSEWFHPFLRSAEGQYSIEFERLPEGTTPVLQSDDPLTQIRLNNLTDLINLRTRWRKALRAHYKSIHKMINTIRTKEDGSLSEEELLTELSAQADYVNYDIGNQPFAIVRKAFLDRAAQKDELIFNELMVDADLTLNVVSLAKT